MSRKHLCLSIYRKVCLPIKRLIGNQTVRNDLIHRSTKICRLVGLVGDSKWQYNQCILNTRGIFVIAIQQKQYRCQHQYSHLLSPTFIANVRTYIYIYVSYILWLASAVALICPPACLAVHIHVCLNNTHEAAIALLPSTTTPTYVCLKKEINGLHSL